jgi:demethoxyubiquinone hydroxylase (CLK1/Coq7/Cat5 family)
VRASAPRSVQVRASLGRPFWRHSPFHAGAATSLSGARASAEPAPVPASMEEAKVVEGEAAPLPEEAIVAKSRLEGW